MSPTQDERQTHTYTQKDRPTMILYNKKKFLTQVKDILS